MQTDAFTIETLSSLEQSIPFTKYTHKPNILVQIFCGQGKETLQTIATALTKNLPHAICIGATTDGEIINAEVSTMSTVVTISSFDKTNLRSFACTSPTSREVGENLAKKLVTKTTKLLIVLSDGTTANGEDLLQGIYKYAPLTTIAGGMAGDNASFTQTYVSHGSELIKSGAVAVALDSDHLQVRNHYSFDWQPIGKKMLVTHSVKNRVYTINNQPAAHIYAHYLGDEIAKQMPGTGIEFPLVMENNGIRVARAILAAHDDGSLSFAGNIPQQAEVQFGFGNTASIINNSISGSTSIATKKIETFFIYSCMARRRYMPETINVEIVPFSNSAPTAGFFTYGEFFHTLSANELMNQTLTVVALSESDQSIFEESSNLQVDITQHKDTVHTFSALSHLIKASTDELNEAFDLFDSGQFILFKWRNLNGWPVDYVSNNVTSILGYSAKNFLQDKLDFTTLIHPDDLQIVLSDTQRATSNNSCEHYIYDPYRVKNSDGEYIWIYDTRRIIRNDHGEVTHLVGYLTDITQRKKSEEELLLYATIFHNSSEAIIVTDNSNRIISVNPAFCVITGYSEQDALGNTPSFLASGKHSANFYQTMWIELISTGKWKGEIWNRRKSGELFAEWLSISTVYDKSGKANKYIALFSDITEVKRVNERVEFLAHHDALTALPNRILFQDRMQQAILHASRNKVKIALLYIDIDHFKSINDSLGHRVGDLLLKDVVKRLQTTLRRDDTISRQGGDEFLIMIDQMENNAPVRRVIEKIMNCMKPVFNIDGNQIHTSSSIGITIYPDDGDNFDTLLQHADTAMYHAKQEGRSTHHFFTSEMHAEAKQKHFMQNYMHEAIGKNEFYLEYQPQYCLSSATIVGVEALLRWNSAELGMVGPDVFIPISEENGQIIEIGNWVIIEACQQLQLMHHHGHHNITMAINISALQFKQANFTSHLLSIIKEFDIEPSNIELELTESILIRDIQRNLDTLSKLKKEGFKLAIDDFGTGYSSLSYLKRFPADVLKIDRAFISDIIENKNDASIVKAIIGLCKNFELKVIAEGVETKEQFDYLQQQGCDIIQGYLYSRPISSAKLMNKLSDQKIK